LRRLPTLLLAVILLAGCAAQATPTPASTDTAAPSPSPTASAPAEAAPSPTPSPAPAPEGPRALTQAELEELYASLPPEQRGFFLCTYDRPEEIDWNEVLYDGAGLSVELTEEQLDDYTYYNGEVIGALEAIPVKALEEFVWYKTWTRYDATRNPLFPDWYWLDDGDKGIYCFDHGDSNMQPIEFTAGTVDEYGYEYKLYYTRAYDYKTYRSDRPFVLTASVVDGNWRYISNVPADAPEPLPLLEMDYVDS